MGTFLQKSHLVGALIEWDKMAHGRALHQKSGPLHHLHHAHGLCPYGTYGAPVAGTWPPIGGAIPLDAVCDVIQLDTCNGRGLDKSLCKPNEIVWRPCEGGRRRRANRWSRPKRQQAHGQAASAPRRAPNSRPPVW